MIKNQFRIIIVLSTFNWCIKPQIYQKGIHKDARKCSLWARFLKLGRGAP